MEMTTITRPRSYGYRVTRAGEVYAFTSPGRRSDIYVGRVTKIALGWWRHELEPVGTFGRQTEAARALVAIVAPPAIDIEGA